MLAWLAICLRGIRNNTKYQRKGGILWLFYQGYLSCDTTDVRRATFEWFFSLLCCTTGGLEQLSLGPGCTIQRTGGDDKHHFYKVQKPGLATTQSVLQRVAIALI